MYSEKAIQANAQKCLDFPHLYDLKVRYAMKACPNVAILQTLRKIGLGIDASSGFEVERALLAGFEATDISLSSQQLAHNMVELVSRGVALNACSMKQLTAFGEAFPGLPKFRQSHERIWQQ